MHVVDGLGIDELGRIYNVHRATAARWLVRIREALFAGTRSALAKHLDLGETEFASLVGVLLSRLDVSVQRVLGEIDEDPP
jgi:RNA polymerase sigma-70 factor (ECF subfamily)